MKRGAGLTPAGLTKSEKGRVIWPGAIACGRRSLRQRAGLLRGSSILLIDSQPKPKSCLLVLINVDRECQMPEASTRISWPRIS